MWQTVPDLNSRGTVGRKQAGPGGRIRYEKPPLGSSEDNTNFSFSLYSGSLIHKGGSLIHKGGISTFKDVQNEMVFKFSNLFKIFKLTTFFKFPTFFKFSKFFKYTEFSKFYNLGTTTLQLGRWGPERLPE